MALLETMKLSYSLIAKKIEEIFWRFRLLTKAEWSTDFCVQETTENPLAGAKSVDVDVDVDVLHP